MVSLELVSCWDNFIKNSELSGNNSNMIFLYLNFNSLEYYFQLVYNRATSMNEFEILLGATNAGSVEYRSTRIAFAYWIHIRSNSSISISYLEAFKYFEILDTLLIVYGPNDDVSKVIEVSTKLKHIVFQNFNSARNEFPTTDFDMITTTKHDKILTLSDPSLSLFKTNMNSPLLIQKLITLWPALTKWKNPSFWIKCAGHRFFPVEIGDSYLSEGWKQDIIQLNDYFEKYVFITDPNNIAYIAQHNWLHQIPSLSQDFAVPDLCDIFLDSNQDRPFVHMWFGMKNTCSPLHFDKYNNIFTQVAGYKYIILVDPKFSTLIPKGPDNNSCIIQHDNLLNFLDMHNISYHELIVKPGDSLYIPKYWWHQVKSLSFSISISFWF